MTVSPTATFRNAVIILTSNLGAQQLLQDVAAHGTVTPAGEKQVLGAPSLLRAPPDPNCMLCMLAMRSMRSVLSVLRALSTPTLVAPSGFSSSVSSSSPPCSVLASCSRLVALLSRSWSKSGSGSPPSSSTDSTTSWSSRRCLRPPCSASSARCATPPHMYGRTDGRRAALSRLAASLAALVHSALH